MTNEELQKWLDEQFDEIFRFMEYEPSIDSEEQLATTLGYWFGNDEWKEGGHRFLHLGIDGAGGQFAIWLRPGFQDPHPVVYLGSEGGAGVVASSPENWALSIAHAPGLNEYPTAGGPATLEPELNYLLDEEGEEGEEAKEALARYRTAAEERFGAIPELSKLTGDLDELNQQFAAWMAKALG